MHTSRKKAGTAASLLLALLFGSVLLAVHTFDLYVSGPVVANQPLKFTLRVPGVGVFRDTMESGGATFQHVRRIFPRGSVLSNEDVRVVQAIEDLRRPPRFTLILGLGLALVLVLFLFSRFTASDSRDTARLRVQLSLVVYLTLFCVAAKIFLLLSPWSAMWIPLSLLVIPVALHLGQRTAAAAAVAGAVILSLHTRIDITLLLVMLGQGLSAAMLAGRDGPLRVPLAALGAAAGGGAAFLTCSLLVTQPLVASPLQSGLLATVAGAAVGAVLALAAAPLLGRALGLLSRGKLLALANLDAPLLKQLAAKAPGTWAHSMAMANMAEMAANAIGADGLLVRVGAYYHDLGKSVQPNYFIENQEGPNPHDELPPDVSADAIFSHVVDGVKMARKHKLPEPVVEFIFTHHGQSLLEYFWHKNQEAGNPKQLDETEFRYPGQRPRTREAAILSICDAVEAASRTLEDPTPEQIRALVWNIALGKMNHGLIDDAGLTLAELQKVMISLAETLRSSRHGRIRYPWQEGRTESATVTPPAGTADQAPAPQTTASSPVPTPQAPAQPPGNGDPAWAEGGDEQLAERNRVMTKPLGVETEALEQPLEEKSK